MLPAGGCYARRCIAACAAPYHLKDVLDDYYMYNVIGVFEEPFLSISTPLRVG